MRIGIVLLARIASTRLPGKVLLDLCGKPVLEHIVRRLKMVKPCDELIVATTANPKDDVIAALCKKLKITFFRGSENNVLDRCIMTAEKYKLDIIIRLGSDNCFVDHSVINEMLGIYLDQRARGDAIEYMSNTLERSFPSGMDIEIFNQETFRKIDRAIQTLPEDEKRSNEINVVPYLHQNIADFKVFSYKKDFDYSSLRWTLDTSEDFDLITRVYESLYPSNPCFLTADILGLLKVHPDWAFINAKVVPKSGYWTKIEQDKLKRRLTI